MKEKFYTVKDLCEYFDVTRQAVTKWIENGKVKVKRTPGGRVRITEEEFMRVTGGQ
jgi:putative resolvase